MTKLEIFLKIPKLAVLEHVIYQGREWRERILNRQFPSGG